MADAVKLDCHAIAKDAAERVHKNGGCVPQMAYAPILWALQDVIAASPPSPEEAPAEGAGDWGGGDVVALVDPSRWDHPANPQIAYANGRNDALRNRTSEPEAGAVVVKAICQHCQRATVVPPETLALAHPAPATADKLRVAVEALEKADAAARSGAAMCAADYHITTENLGEAIYTITTPALAALNERPQ